MDKHRLTGLLIHQSITVRIVELAKTIGVASLLFVNASLGVAAQEPEAVRAEKLELHGGPDSVITVFVPRAGLLKFLGHDHTIETRSFSGILELKASGEPGPRVASLTVEVPVESLAVLDGEADPETREEVRRDMVSEKVLAAETYERVSFSSSDVEIGADGMWHVNGDLTIRDTTRNVSFSADVDLQETSVFAEGVMPLKLTDFGINPVSALAGTIRTADTIEIRFSVKGRVMRE